MPTLNDERHDKTFCFPTELEHLLSLRIVNSIQGYMVKWRVNSHLGLRSTSLSLMKG